MDGGYDLIEFTLPEEGTPLDCYVELELQIDRQLYFAGLLSISDGPGTCHHRLGLGAAEMTALDNGSYLPFVRLSASNALALTAVGSYSRDEEVVALISPASPSDAWRATGSAPLVRPGMTPATTCRTEVPVSGFAGVQRRDGTFGSLARNPGVALANGPGSRTFSLTESIEGFFRFSSPVADPLPWGQLVSGKWSIDLPADGAYAPATADFQIPAQLELTEAIQPPSLTQDFRARWNPSTFRPGDLVRAQFASSGNGGLIQAMTCMAPAQAGELTVSASNLTWLWDGPSDHCVRVRNC
jgi:hypothetical protein